MTNNHTTTQPRAARNPWRAASVAKLDALRPDINGATIRAAWRAETWSELFEAIPAAADMVRDYYRPPAFDHVKREAITAAAGYCGAEYLGRDGRTGNDVHYANAGDTYTATLIFSGHVLLVSSWGEVFERRRWRHLPQY